MVTTLKSGAVYSPVDDSARKIGRNAAAVVSDATRRRTAQFPRRVDRRIDRLPTDPHLHCDRLGHHDGVVDQHPEGGGSTLQARSGRGRPPRPTSGTVPRRSSPARGSPLRTRSQPHEQNHHAHDDADRLEQAADESPDPGVDRRRSEPRDFELDPDRMSGLEPGNLAPDDGAQRDDVAALPHGDRQARALAFPRRRPGGPAARRTPARSPPSPPGRRSRNAPGG